MTPNACKVLPILLLSCAMTAQSTWAQDGNGSFCVYTGTRGFSQLPRSYNLSGKIDFPYVMVKKAARDDFEEGHFFVKATRVENAFAYIDAHGLRHILLGENWLLDLVEQTETLWASYSVIAHEFGHHRHNHFFPASTEVCQRNELEADHYSGDILCRMGASLEDATSVMNLIGTADPDGCHPEKSRRVAAIERGWRECRASGLMSEAPPHPEYCFHLPITIGDGISRRGNFRNLCNRTVRITGVMTIDRDGGIAGIYNLPHGSKCLLAPQEGCRIDLDLLGVPQDESLSLPRAEYFDQ